MGTRAGEDAAEHRHVAAEHATREDHAGGQPERVALLDAVPGLVEAGQLR
jgi:hypothetical protein